MKKSSINMAFFLILSFFVSSKASFYSDYQNEDNAITFLERLIELSQNSDPNIKKETKDLLELLFQYSMNAGRPYCYIDPKIKTALLPSGFIHPNGSISPTFKKIVWYLEKDKDLKFYFNRSAFNRHKRRKENTFDQNEFNTQEPLKICTIL